MGQDISALQAKGFTQQPDGSFSKVSSVTHDRIVWDEQKQAGVVSNPNEKIFVVPIEPVPAPRMTRSDKWKTPRRPVVQKFFDYRDAIQAAIGPVNDIAESLDCVFYLPMPDSWSDKKKADMDGKLHRQRPDWDNLCKAVMDSLYEEDGCIPQGSGKKYWSKSPRVEIKFTFAK